MRLWYLLHEVLTETTLAQPIIIIIPFAHVHAAPGGTDRNNTPVSEFMSP